jgi:hypothetical protein
MCIAIPRCTLERSTDVLDAWEVVTMIEWGSDSWGGNVHYAENGSWVTDRHGDDSDHSEE